MIPRDAQIMIEARIEHQETANEGLYKHFEMMFARQTAQLCNMQGRFAEKPIEPKSCMTFDWDGSGKKGPITGEMTEEEMENFDRNMDTHRGRRNG